MKHWLEPDVFSSIVRHTPLVSIDLVTWNREGQALLGRRRNRPAQGSWFVPGGRIAKDERLTDAFRRIAVDELGESHEMVEATFFGIYEHFHPDNFSGADFSTHYVVLSFELLAPVEITSLPTRQHGEYRWFEIEELLYDPDVHRHVKDYFLNRPGP